MVAVPVGAGEWIEAERSWNMRLRMTLAAAVLGLAAATVTLARQQAGDAPPAIREQRNAPAQAALANLQQMRVHVAELRAEVEIADIEHEADKALLSLMMKEIGEAQWKEATQPSDPGVERTAGRPGGAARENKSKVRSDIAEAELQRRKARFRERVVRLHEMKFALADLEERLTNGWGR
jgi:hypothetical protein